MPENETPDARRAVPVGGMFPGEEVPRRDEPPQEEPVESAEAPSAPSWTGGAPAPETPADLGPPRFRLDAVVAALAALLAASTFLPWYRTKVPGGIALAPETASGWATGTWGPLIFFLALASLALIVLRRAGVRVSLPVEETLVHEAVGWISVIGVVIKSRAIPNFSTFGTEDRALGIWVALGAAFLLAFFGGRMSPRASVVFVPGWYRGPAGRLGAALLAVALAGGVAFAFVNDAGPKRLGARLSETRPEVVKGKLHRCAQGAVPIPAGVRVDQSYRQKGTYELCVAVLRTDTLTVRQAAAAMRAALEKLGYKVTVQQSADALAQMQISGRRCGSVFVSAAILTPAPGQTPGGGGPIKSKGASIVASLYDCQAVRLPTPPGR